MAAAGAGQKRQDTISFGKFELNPAGQTLFSGGVPIKLQRQPFQVLQLLAQRAPEIVSRDEIRLHVWGEAVYVDTTQSINFCIRQIRLALGDTGTGSRFIETLPRQGYRFIAPVQGPGANTAKPELVSPRPSTPRFLKRAWLITGIAGFIAASASVAIWAWLHGRNTDLKVVGISRITTYSGDEREPSLSPDGREVAFSWEGETGDNRDVYIKHIGQHDPVRLTNDSAEDAQPAWSPDGKSIAFLRRRSGTRADIMLVPAIGGTERKLREIRLGKWLNTRVLAWTPDGKWICFTDETAVSGHHRLFLLSPESNAVRLLLPEEENGIGDSSPAFSPDTRWLAYARFQYPFNSKLLIQRLSPDLIPQGTPLVIKDAGVNPKAPVWMSAGRRILFLDGSRIMDAEIGGSAHPLYVSPSVFGELTLATSSRRLLAPMQSVGGEIWMLPLGGQWLKIRGSAYRILQSSSGEGQPRFSPDGRSLAFTSDRSGASEVWIADSDGSRPRQLTYKSFHIAGYVRWSPDSKLVAFHGRLPSEPQIYTARIADGLVTQLTHRKPGLMAPSWASDGMSIYADALENGKNRTYRVPVPGGEPQLLFEGSDAIELPARNLLIFEKEDESGIYYRSLIGDIAKNPEHLIVSDYHTPWGGFYPVDNGIYYIGSTSAGRALAFRFYSFDTGSSMDVGAAPNNLGVGLAVTPDRTRLAYSTNSRGSEDLIQIDFR